MATRDDLVVAVQGKLAEATGGEVLKKSADQAVEAVLEALFEVIMGGEAGETIRTPIGTFTKQVKAARNARNPRTGETIEVPAKEVLAFRVSKARLAGKVEKPAKTVKVVKKALRK